MLHRMFGASIIDETNLDDLRQTNKPTIYIVSHRFSYMDIVLAFDVIGRATIRNRTIAGVANVPPIVKSILTNLFNCLKPKIQFVSYNTRGGNTSELLASNLREGDDVIVWQHPYNKHKSLYHLLSETRPRLVYIDIASRRSEKTINDMNLFAILGRTCCHTYTITSREINYSAFLRENEIDIIDGFNRPLWDEVGATTFLAPS